MDAKTLNDAYAKFLAESLAWLDANGPMAMEFSDKVVEKRVVQGLPCRVEFQFGAEVSESDDWTWRLKQSLAVEVKSGDGGRPYSLVEDFLEEPLTDDARVPLDCSVACGDGLDLAVQQAAATEAFLLDLAAFERGSLSAELRSGAAKKPFSI